MLETTFEQRVALIEVSPDGDGFCATVRNLPGCATQSEELWSLQTMILEALFGCLHTYLSEKMTVPWSDPPPPTQGCYQWEARVAYRPGEADTIYAYISKRRPLPQTEWEKLIEDASNP